MNYAPTPHRIDGEHIHRNGAVCSGLNDSLHGELFTGTVNTDTEKDEYINRHIHREEVACRGSMVSLRRNLFTG